MNAEDQGFSLNKKAKISGALYLAMAPFAGFSLFVNFSNFVHDNPLETANNIQSAIGFYWRFQEYPICNWVLSAGNC